MPNDWSPRVFRATAKDVDLARAAIGEVHQRVPVDGQALAAFLADASCYWVVTNDANHAAMARYRRRGFVRRHPDDVMLSIAL